MDEWIKKQLKGFMRPGDVDKYHKRWTQRKIATPAYQKLLKYAEPGKTFLDLGCHFGWACHDMKERGLIELGIDLPEVIENIVRYDINTKAMNLEEEFPEGRFDIVHCVETIEHLRNYEEFCRQIVEALRPDGVAVVVSPLKDVKSPFHCVTLDGNKLNELVEDSGGKIIESFTQKASKGVLFKRS
jgi:2-polyprenyl-3-methyl-5-hydroxy-6-metoxy-1,4-benzoquinol methylase